MRLKTVMFAKNQRVITDKYRRRYIDIFCNKNKDCQCFECRFNRRFKGEKDYGKV